MKNNSEENNSKWQEQTDKRRYLSKYSGEEKFVNAAQFIAEIVCEKKARAAKKDLPIKFWNLQEWKAEYRKQLNMAYRLLKTFSAAAILNALRHTNAFAIGSLGNPRLKPIIEQEQQILNTKLATKPNNIVEYNTDIVTEVGSQYVDKEKKKTGKLKNIL